jgi:hypothetical protein
MYTSSHYELLLPLVLSGDTVLLAPTFVVQPYLEAGEMVILDVQWRFDAKYHFVTTRAASFSRIVTELREHAVAIGAQLSDDWRGVASRLARAVTTAAGQARSVHELTQAVVLHGRIHAADGAVEQGSAAGCVRSAAAPPWTT